MKKVLVRTAGFAIAVVAAAYVVTAMRFPSFVFGGRPASATTAIPCTNDIG